jgi:hypothetical protein
MKDINHVTPELLNDIDSVNQLCVKLHVPAPPIVWVTAEVFGPDGTIEARYHEQARSWTRNFYNYLASALLPCTTAVDPGVVGFGAGSTYVTATNGAVRASSTYILAPEINQPSALIGNSGSSYGLFVGTGTGACDFEGYALGAMISNGSGSGQLAWIAPVDADPTYNSETKKWTKSFYRDFANNSGGTITIGETGLYWHLKPSGSDDCFMTERNVPVTPYDVPDGRTARVTYTTEITFPA